MPGESVASIIASHADGIFSEAPRPKGHSPVSTDSLPPTFRSTGIRNIILKVLPFKGKHICH